MKKQIFVVEITLPETDVINVNEVIAAIDRGFDYPDWRIDAAPVGND